MIPKIAHRGGPCRDGARLTCDDSWPQEKKPQLTPEEAAKAAEELRLKAKQKRQVGRGCLPRVLPSRSGHAQAGLRAWPGHRVKSLAVEGMMLHDLLLTFCEGSRAIHACRTPVGSASMSPLKPPGLPAAEAGGPHSMSMAVNAQCVKPAERDSCSLPQKEEAELEKLREQERIRSGKEMAAAKRQEEDLRLKRNLELRRIEKEEEERARARIRAKLGGSG